MAGQEIVNGIAKLTWNDIIRFGGVLIACGIMWQKLDNLSEKLISTSLDAKEYRIRIEKLELSVTAVTLEIQQIRLDEDKRERYTVHPGTGKN